MTIKFGVDMGQSSLKGVGEKGSVLFPSLAALIGSSSVDVSMGRKKKRPMVVRDDEIGELFVGHSAHTWGVPVENFDFARLAGVTPEMRAIFYGAMTEYQRKHGRFEDPLELVVGLPMQMLSGDDESVKKLSRQVKGWIGGTHHWNADGEAFEMFITRVDLVPQALGAVIDYAFDIHGESISADRNKALTQESATAWFGSNTVELQVTKRDDDTKRFCGGSAIGVRWLHNQVDPDGSFTFGEFDERLRRGELPEHMDVKPFLGPWGTQVFGFLDRKWGQAYKRFYRIFAGGGGIYLLKEQVIAKFNGQVIIPEDPILSLANGFYKAALRSK